MLVTLWIFYTGLFVFIPGSKSESILADKDGITPSDHETSNISVATVCIIILVALASLLVLAEINTYRENLMFMYRNIKSFVRSTMYKH